MTDYADRGHRPHAVHTGEMPRNPIVEAPYHLDVTLDTWGPRDHLFTTIYNALQSNWGNAPNQVRCSSNSADPCDGWGDLNANQQDYVRSCFKGQTLPQIKELISFAFTINGVSRACTHQLVRTRVGAAFMQHGGRDNDWRHRPWIMPETIHRLVRQSYGSAICLCQHTHAPGEPCSQCDCGAFEAARSCVRDWGPIDRLLDSWSEMLDLREGNFEDLLSTYLQLGRQIYAALVDAGIPWQDARRVLWMGTGTYLHATYNFLALEGLLRNRLEHVMDWEINCVAQLMLREVRMKCPFPLWEFLGSASDLAKEAKFAGLESWPPDGKWPIPQQYQNLPRSHQPEQNPFWVLHPSSFVGGPIRWIATNGTYPKEK